MKKKLQGFSLIELLIVIVILGALSALISGNFINSLKKGNDSKRKTDLEQVRRAIELYYEDTGTYPIFADNKIPAATSLCYLNDVTKCATKVYMQKLPTDPKPSCFYYYLTDGKTYYKMYSYIENSLDSGAGVIQGTGYNISCGCGACRFGTSSPNTSP